MLPLLQALSTGGSACAELAQKPSCFHRVSSFEVPCKHVSMGLLIISVNHSRIRLPPWGQCPGSPASFTSCPSAPFPPPPCWACCDQSGGTLVDLGQLLPLSEPPCACLKWRTKRLSHGRGCCEDEQGILLFQGGHNK